MRLHVRKHLTHGTDKTQRAALSSADIYFQMFIVLYVKIIRKSVLQHVDLRGHLHRPLFSFFVALFLSVSFPNQKHIGSGFEHTGPKAGPHVEMNRAGAHKAGLEPD